MQSSKTKKSLIKKPTHGSEKKQEPQLSSRLRSMESHPDIIDEVMVTQVPD